MRSGQWASPRGSQSNWGSPECARGRAGGGAAAARGSSCCQVLAAPGAAVGWQRPVPFMRQQLAAEAHAFVASRLVASRRLAGMPAGSQAAPAGAAHAAPLPPLHAPPHSSNPLPLPCNPAPGRGAEEAGQEAGRQGGQAGAALGWPLAGVWPTGLGASACGLCPCLRAQPSLRHGPSAFHHAPPAYPCCRSPRRRRLTSPRRRPPRRWVGRRSRRALHS